MTWYGWCIYKIIYVLSRMVRIQGNILAEVSISIIPTVACKRASTGKLG